MRGNKKAQELILKAVKSIADATHPQKVILYGSYANGNPSIHSDVDILVIKEERYPPLKSSINMEMAAKAVDVADSLFTILKDQMLKSN